MAWSCGPLSPSLLRLSAGKGPEGTCTSHGRDGVHHPKRGADVGADPSRVMQVSTSVGVQGPTGLGGEMKSRKIKGCGRDLTKTHNDSIAGPSSLIALLPYQKPSVGVGDQGASERHVLLHLCDIGDGRIG